MAILGLGEYNATHPTYATNGQHGKLQIDEEGRLLVTTASEDASSAYLSNVNDSVVLAAPTGSTDGLGKLAATIANTQAIYVRFDAAGYAYADWIVAHAQQADLVFYKALTIADNVTLTLASFTEGDTIILNGLTLTGDTTAAQALYSGQKFLCASDNADATALAALINADYSVVTAGTSVAGTDTLVITTDEGAHTLTARAAADLTLGEYTLSGTAATEMANIVLAINHTQNVTCTTADATGDTVTINDITYTGAAAEDLTARAWHADSSNASTAATSLAACINSATYGNTDLTAVASAAVVYIYRDSEAASISLASSNATRLACVTTVGGVPGVTAVATGGTAELSITPTWTHTLTVTETGARLTVTDIDCPGIYATSTGSSGVVTLVPGTPASRTHGDLATVISATAAARCTVSQAATLAALIVDADTTAAANEAATTGALGSHHPQAVSSYPYLYLGLTADNATPQAVSVTVKPRP